MQECALKYRVLHNRRCKLGGDYTSDPWEAYFYTVEEVRRLKDETAECKYRGVEARNPCVNSGDPGGEEKRQHPPARVCLEFD